MLAVNPGYNIINVHLDNGKFPLDDISKYNTMSSAKILDTVYVDEKK